MHINIKNEGKKKIFWEIGEDSLKQEDYLDIFKIEPSQGYLKGREDRWIDVNFSPITAGNYEIKVPVYLNKNYKESSIDVILKGKSSNPKI